MPFHKSVLVQKNRTKGKRGYVQKHLVKSLDKDLVYHIERELSLPIQAASTAKCLFTTAGYLCMLV